MNGELKSVNIFFVNLKFLHCGIYLKYFLYLFVAVLNDIISDFHIRFMKAYISLITLSKL